MWRPTTYSEEDFAAFREALADSPIDAVLIHAVYLLNCASDDKDIRAKSLASLTHSLRVGQAIGASAVVLHPGSAKQGHVGDGDRPSRQDLSPRRSQTARAASCTWRTPPARAARSGAPSRSWPR